MLLFFASTLFAEPEDVVNYKEESNWWHSKFWYYQADNIDGEQRGLKLRKHFKRAGIDKVSLFQKFQSPNKYVIAFGPFDSKEDAAKFFKKNKKDENVEFTYEFRSEQVLRGKIWHALINPVKMTKSKQTFSGGITSIVAKIESKEFDYSNCILNLEFSNKSSGKSFNVKMEVDSENRNKFRASQNDIKDGLSKASLTASENDWSQLSVRFKKTNDKSVTCETVDQEIFSITDGEFVNTFLIHPDGLLETKSQYLVKTQDDIVTKSDIQDTKTIDVGDAHLQTISHGKPSKIEILNMQKALKAYGLNLEIDGLLGPGTKKAIERYQRFTGANPTGTLTPDQYQALVDTDWSTDRSAGDQPQIDPPQIDQLSTSTMITDLELELIKLQSSKFLLVQNIKDLNYDLKQQKEKFLNIYKKPFYTMYTYVGVPPGAQQEVYLDVKFVNCRRFNAKTTVQDDLKYLMNKDGCVKVVHSDYERIPGSLASISDQKMIVTLKLKERFSKTISSISHKTANNNFDPITCAFNLKFTHVSSKKSFMIDMLPVENGKKFVATKTEIEDMINKNDFDLEEFDWRDFKVAAKKSETLDTTCEPNDLTPQKISDADADADSKFTISSKGALVVTDIGLAGTLDELIVFVSKNIGLPDTASGGEIFSADYPFVGNLTLQDFYIERALAALQKYVRKSDVKFKNIRIFEADTNSYIEFLNQDLQNIVPIIDASALIRNHTNPSKEQMPSVYDHLKELDVPDTSGILVIGSFGFPKSELCNSIEYDQIMKTKDKAAIAVLSFIPIRNVFEKNYQKVAELPPTRACPNSNNKILLIYPDSAGKDARDEILEGFYNLINRGLEN